MMKRYLDFSCWVGGWPFHKIRKGGLQDLVALHRKYGISGGYVSSTDAIFYNDPWEAEWQLHKQLVQTPAYRHVPVVNPTLPGWRENWMNLEKLPAAGVRVFPGIHGYSLEHPEFLALIEKLSEQSLPLFFTLRAEDARVCYLLSPRSIDIDELKGFLSRPFGCPIILSNLYKNEALKLRDTILSKKYIWLDTCGLKDGLFTLEELQNAQLTDRIIYASFTPLLCLASSMQVVRSSSLVQEQKEAILRGDAFFKAEL